MKWFSVLKIIEPALRTLLGMSLIARGILSDQTAWGLVGILLLTSALFNPLFSKYIALLGQHKKQ